MTPPTKSPAQWANGMLSDFDDLDADLGDDLTAASLAEDIREFEAEFEQARPTPSYYESDEVDDYGSPYAAPATGLLDKGGRVTPSSPTTWGGAPAAKGWGGRGTYSYGNRGTYSYGGSYLGAYGYARGSYSSWYSGYSSARSAMRGVHRTASSFVRDPSYQRLTIYPSSHESLPFYCAEPGDRNRSIHIRIDGSLYEAMGIERAQQHYSVDAIGQALALQAMPNSELARSLQNMDSFLPRVVREVVTEVIRRRGMDLLTEEAPGWDGRIQNFKRAMIPALPAADDEPHIARFNTLIRAAWRPSSDITPELIEAAQIIETVDSALDDGKLGLCSDVARAILGYVSSSSEIGGLILVIERMIAALYSEYQDMAHLLPEPPFNASKADQLLTDFDQAQRLLVALHDKAKHAFIDSGSREHRNNVSRLVLILERFRMAHSSTLMALRHSSCDPILHETDVLTAELHGSRLKQCEIDRECDRIRADYERKLNQPAGPGSSGSLKRHFKRDSLSLLWAHASMDSPVLSVEPSSPADGETYAQQIEELNQLKAAYHDATKRLLRAAQESDEIEMKLSSKIEEYPAKGLEPFARFASSAAADAFTRLSELLQDLSNHQNSLSSSCMDLSPCRPGTSGDGDGDELVVDGTPESEGGRGKGESGTDSKGERRLSHNHGDLIVAADVCSEELPQIGTNSDPKEPPDIVVYDATDHTVIAKESSY